MAKIIKITGGLGNQLFQYAYGRKLEIINKKDIIFDTSFFYENKKDTSRPFLLDKFNINPKANFKYIKRNSIHKFFLKIKDFILLRLIKDYNFYQNEKYFIDIKNNILTEYIPRTSISADAQNVLNQIRLNDNSVSIHVRRGDYVTNNRANKTHGICDLKYYNEAVALIKSKLDNITFFIFSDDINWTKENLKIEDARYVSNPSLKEFEEMILMSNCKHNIIANSTFSWWSAYLNKNHDKIIIAPSQWNVKKTANQLDILPKSWLQI